MAKLNDYTIRLMRHRPGKEPDEIVAEFEIEGSKHGAAATARHYERHARLFMTHIRFDYAVAV